MSLQVSSWFIDQARAQSSRPIRRFTMGGSDYSGQVLRWPSLNFRSGTIDLGTTSILLGNIGGPFNFLVDCGLFLTTSCGLSIGFTHPESGREEVELFMGSPSHLSYPKDGNELRMQLQGKTKRLTDTSLGSDTESGGLDFTGSAYYPSDLAWTLITCYGGLSALQDASNPDIDYGEWSSWQDANEVRDTRVRAYLTGERIFQVVDRLTAMDSRLVSFQNGRLHFRDEFSPFGEVFPELPPDHLIDFSLVLDPDGITNHFFVEADFNPAKSTFVQKFSRVHSDSQAVFGIKSGRMSFRGLWFDSADDGRYLAEDRIRFRAWLRPQARVTVPLGVGLEYAVGDVVSLPHSGFGWQARPFRVEAQAVHLERGLMDMRLGQAERRRWQFQGTVSSANLDTPSLQPVGAAGLLALAEQGGTQPVMRSDSGGGFLPTGLFATALRVINGQEVLLGGAPSSGASQAVLQRSSDGGLTAVTVSSLDPFVFTVHDIFEVVSGTYLASTNSGGIYRSTDGGSSWNLTQTISGAYHVNRFFSPVSGTLWGGTGFSDALLGQGLSIWASTDQGQTWSPLHTVQDSGNYLTTGFYALPDSEFLMGHSGPSIVDLAILRSKTLAPSSLDWTSVATGFSISHVLQASSGNLLAGFYEPSTLNGGIIRRSLDAGSSWIEDTRVAKQGNLRLLSNSDGTVDGFVSRMTVGARTDQYRNFEPQVLG